MYKIDIKEFRRKNKLTQKQFAAYLGVGQGFVSQMENGINPIPEKYIRKILDDSTVDSSMVIVESLDSEVKMSREVFDKMSRLIDTVCSQQGTIAGQQDLLSKMQMLVDKALTPPHHGANTMDGADSEGNRGSSAVG
ncbi:helix-turn-helix domain-containing protein [Alistipes shahii]|jgi:transcriptional regulator with XRE-family HTH domain|uniref:helix-turn-helix domain-containing protein n=1 Tax=Alistipes shahii TaxID=328814 RepID=UPI003AB3680B